MTVEDFAEQLGIAPRTVAYWHARPEMTQRPLGQRILDTTYDNAPDAVKTRFAILISKPSPSALAQGREVSALNASPGLSEISVADARDVLAWVESTNANDGFINYFDQTVKEIAKEHACYPPAVLLTKVQQFHGMIQTMLRGGRQRHHQTRELLRLDADLLSHMCQLLGDTHRDEAASAYAMAAVGLADEAGASPAAAFSAQAQIARWRGRYKQAADLAARGFESNPSPALRTLLAYQEADAAAASGQMPDRARAALEKADAGYYSPSFYSAWSCPPARRALFRMGVTLNLGDPSEALRLAAAAEPMWQQEKPRAFGTWAHFRIAVAKAHILAGSAEDAAGQIVPVLDLPQEYRISTLAGHFTTFDALLAEQRFSKSREVTSLRELLKDFRETTSPELTNEEDE
jgi:tetratricopeptide (TPR) repeat protein